MGVPVLSKKVNQSNEAHTSLSSPCPLKQTGDLDPGTTHRSESTGAMHGCVWMWMICLVAQRWLPWWNDDVGGNCGMEQKERGCVAGDAMCYNVDPLSLSIILVFESLPVVSFSDSLAFLFVGGTCTMMECISGFGMVYDVPRYIVVSIREAAPTRHSFDP